jgi:hypothetical protein
MTEPDQPSSRVGPSGDEGPGGGVVTTSTGVTFNVAKGSLEEPAGRGCVPPANADTGRGRGRTAA